MGEESGRPFPQQIAKAIGLSDGERVEIETSDDTIVIRRAIPHFTLEDLFQGKNPRQWRALYAEAYEWELDVGREQIRIRAMRPVPAI